MRGLAAVLLTVCLGALGACEGSPSGQTRTTAPIPTPTPLSDLASPAQRAVSRALFCDRVSPTAIEHAIGGPPESSRSWVNGDKTPTGETGREYGCSWSTTSAGYAAAWVFAPPITRARALTLAKTSPMASCRRLRPQQAPAFGDPGSAYSCSLDSGGSILHLAGLFGDAWLTCEVRLEGPADDPADDPTDDPGDEFCGAILSATTAA